MATYPTFLPGLDAPALGHDLTNGEADTLVRSASFATTVGAFIYAEEAPDTILYPELKRFQWREIDAFGLQTGNRYYFDGTAWTLEKPAAGTIDGDSFADGTIPVNKLSGSGAQPFYVIQRNGSNSQWMIVSLASALQDGSAANIKLENADAADYIKFSIAGGVYSDVLFQYIWDLYLEVSNIRYDQIQDSNDTAQAGQILYFAATGGQAAAAFPEVVMRNNQLPTAKLAFPAGSEGKYPRVNAAKTDVEWVAAFATALLKDVQTNGTDGVAVSAGSAQKIRLNTEIDPSGIVVLDTTANTFLLQPGTYDISAVIPVHQSSFAPSATVILRNETAAADIATVTLRATGDMDFIVGTLNHIVTISVASSFSVKVHPQVSGWVGRAVTLGYSETYSQISIRKIG